MSNNNLIKRLWFVIVCLVQDLVRLRLFVLDPLYDFITRVPFKTWLTIHVILTYSKYMSMHKIGLHVRMSRNHQCTWDHFIWNWIFCWQYTKRAKINWRQGYNPHISDTSHFLTSCCFWENLNSAPIISLEWCFPIVTSNIKYWPFTFARSKNV